MNTDWKKISVFLFIFDYLIFYFSTIFFLYDFFYFFFFEFWIIEKKEAKVA